MLLEGVFKVKDGTHGPWSTLAASGAVAFKLDGNRIGVLHEDGRLRVKRGISGPWHLLDDSGIVSFDLETASPSTERVVFLRADGLLRGQERLANPALVDLAAGVTNFKLAGNRIAATLSNGEFQVTDGLFNAWTVLESEPLRQYELSAQRIGTLTEAGRFRVKDGIHGGWTVLSQSTATAIHLQGNRIGVVDTAGVLLIKSGISGGWTRTKPLGTGVTQFRLIVDNPVPPKRTTPSDYQGGQQDCIDMTSSTIDCYPEIRFAFPVSYYGVFCGGGRPYVTNEAFIFGSIDSFDETCAHHDKIQSWYPEWHLALTEEGISNALNFTGSCIVRYGIHHGRLTLNGVLLADGRTSNDEWNDAWSGAGMYNLWDALYYYKAYTAGCDVTGSLARFDESSDAHND